MPKTVKADHALFLTTLALSVLGVAMVFSASTVWAAERVGDANYFWLRQVLSGSLGMAILFVLMKLDYHNYQKPAFIFSLLSLVVGLCVFVFFLPANRNTHRWIQFSGISFQPSEMAKIALVAFLAYFLDKRKGRINEPSTLVPIGVIVATFAGLILLQRDLGTALALIVTTAILLYMAGLNMKWIGVTSLAALPLGSIAFYLFVYKVQYRWERILAYWNPEAYPKSSAYQIIQSILAVGTGGLNGVGYMESKQKLFYLPDPHTDFIFAVIGEELGLIGTCLVLTLFGIFLWRGLRAARRAPDLFGFYMALGITMTICVQAFLNMSVVLGIVPNKGIPLPFLSYGGSSFVLMLAAVGILLNVSQQGDRSVGNHGEFR
jgi:cell division protein FtsW